MRTLPARGTDRRESISSRRLKLWSWMAENLVTIAFVAVAIAATLFPLYIVVSMSLKSRVDALAYPPRFVFSPTLSNYASVLGLGSLGRGELAQLAGGAGFTRFLVNSAVVSLATIILTLSAGIPGAYALTRYKFRGKKLLAFLIIAMRMIPPIGMVVPLYILVANMRLLDNLGVLVTVYTSLNLALVVWMLRGFFMAVPVEIEEAAMVDGCTRARAVMHTLLPAAAPGLAATAVFTLIHTWNEFTMAFILTQADARTLPVFIAAFANTEEGTYWGQIGAVTTMVLLPVVVFTLLMQRHLVKGMTLGSIKG